MDITLTLVGLISIVGIILGAAWKLYTHIRDVEIQVTNHLQHQLDKMENKIDNLHYKMDNILEKLHEHMINDTHNYK